MLVMHNTFWGEVASLQKNLFCPQLWCSECLRCKIQLYLGCSMFVPMYALLQEMHPNMIPGKPASSAACVIILQCKYEWLSIQQM